jgi:hypothetical protein
MMLPDILQKVVPDFGRSRASMRHRGAAATRVEAFSSVSPENWTALNCQWVEDGDDTVIVGGERFRCGKLHAHWNSL